MNPADAMTPEERFEKDELDAGCGRFAIVLSALALLASAVGIFLAVGCSTVHQDAVTAAQPGFNASPIRVGDHYLVDDAFRDRYNALVAIYGHKRLENGAPVFVPQLERDAGIEPASVPHQWIMSFAAMENFVVLDGLKRRGAAP